MSRSRPLIFVAVAAFAVFAILPAAFGASALITDVDLVGEGPTHWNPNPMFVYFQGTCQADEGYVPVSDGSYNGVGDAFDGGGYFKVGPDTYYDGDGMGEETGESLATGPTKLAGLKVSRTDTALASGPTLRSVIALKNGTRNNITRTTFWESELGSDENTVVSFTSSGDSVFNASDRWVVTSDAEPLTDPAATEVLYGNHNPEVKTDAVLHDGTDTGPSCVTVRYKVKVPARSTRYLIFFLQMHTDLASTGADVNEIMGATRSDAPFAGVPSGTLNKTLNWNV